MIALRHSFKLLSMAEIKRIQLALKRQKKKAAVLKLKQKKSGRSKAGNDKRMFLKLAGVVGLGAVASLFFPKKADALVFGSTPASNVVGVKDSGNTKINPAKEDGNLANIKTSTDPLVAAGAGGYVRQDSTATIAKESGGNLDAIAAQTSKLTFDGSNNLMTAGGGSASVVGLKDAVDTRINPASEDSIIYLRRMVKLMESQAAVDSSNRQRVTVEGATITSGTITTVTTCSTVTSATNLVTIGSWDARQMFADQAHNVYANATRRNLTFS